MTQSVMIRESNGIEKLDWDSKAKKERWELVSEDQNV